MKNFERWVYQRDMPGYATEPCLKIEHPIKMWMVNPGQYFDYIARKGQKIGFDVDDAFTGKSDKFAVKVSYLDSGNGSWSLVYQGKGGVEKRSVQCNDSGSIKTATFFISTDFLNKTIPFDLEIHGNDGYEPVVSFLRIVKIQ